MSGGLYGHRSNSSASSSPPATSGSGQTGLVVPQPINAAKGGQGHAQGATGNGGHIHTHPSNGSSGRKYQCKMCPQVGKVGRLFKGHIITCRYLYTFVCHVANLRGCFYSLLCQWLVT